VPLPTALALLLREADRPADARLARLGTDMVRSWIEARRATISPAGRQA
jgi:hypothetical protein